MFIKLGAKYKVITKILINLMVAFNNQWFFLLGEGNDTPFAQLTRKQMGNKGNFLICTQSSTRESKKTSPLLRMHTHLGIHDHYYVFIIPHLELHISLHSTRAYMH